MGAKQENIIEQLFHSIDLISIEDFEEFINKFLSRKCDRNRAIEELENFMAQLNNKVFLLSLHFKQVHILRVNSEPNTTMRAEEETYSKSTIAQKYRVSVRTVTNWIKDGLECVEIGGVIRISQKALNEFIARTKTKKFKWKSISR